MRRANDDNRFRQIALGAAILAVVAVGLSAALVGWRYVPGVLGEWLGMVIGVLTTPFVLEASLALLGLTIVLAINHWRQQREGEEWVEFERDGHRLRRVADGKRARAEVVVGEVPTLQARAEGALAIEDYETVAELLAAMSEAELKRPETLILRLALAKATHKEHLLEPLEEELRAAKGKALEEAESVR